MSLANALAHMHIGGNHSNDQQSHCAPGVPLSGPARMCRGLSCCQPALDPSKLDYSQADWARWDTFRLNEHSVAGLKRHEHHMGGGEDDPLSCEGSSCSTRCAEGECLQPSAASQCYFHLFRFQVINTFWRESHQRFRCLQLGDDKIGGCDDLLARLQKDKQLLVNETSNMISNALNQEYNHWRAKEMDRFRGEIRAAHSAAGASAIDAASLDAQVQMLLDSTPFHPRVQSGCAPIISWLNEFTRIHLSFQCLDLQLTLDKGSPFGPWKPLGIWANPDGAFEQNTVFWRAPFIGHFYGHYLHLLEDQRIREVRRSMFASLAAQWAWHERTSIGYTHHGESQWTLRIAGFVSHAFVLLRSEAELRQRGTWTLADEVSATDRPRGFWITSELVTFSEELLAELEGRMRLAGHVEFLSSYHGYIMDLLGDLQLHPPSQKCYDLVWSVIRRIQWDLAAHLHPGSGTFSGPSGRSYDLFCGGHNTHDRVDFHLYFKHVFEPWCSLPRGCVLKTRSDGTVLRGELDMRRLVQPSCPLQPDGRLPPVLPPSGDPEPNFHRIWLAKSQLAGQGWLPFDTLEKMQLQRPYRVVEQRISLERGQERFNFLTPEYQIGHAGEDCISLPTAVFACARLAGPAVAGTPKPVVNHGETHCTSYVRLFPRIGVDDDVFHRDKPLGVAGDNRQALSRQVSVQYQGFMLVTSLLGSSALLQPAEMQKGSWNSNLVLPLSVDSLCADEMELPRTAGSAVAIPPNAIFTIRHGGASIAVRLVSFTSEDEVPHCAHMGAVDASNAGEQGKRPFSVMWIVDASSILAGSGRIVVQHRQRDSKAPAPKPYRITWLWGSGKTPAGEQDARALATVLRQAHIQERIVPSAEWNERNQPRDSYPPPHEAHSTKEVGEQRWEVDAFLGAGGPLKLSVGRTDVYLPWGNAPQYKTPASGAMHSKPFFFRDVVRNVNDTPQLGWDEGEDSFRVRQYAPEQLFEPHRAGKCVQVFPTVPIVEHAA